MSESETPRLYAAFRSNLRSWSVIRRVKCAERLGGTGLPYLSSSSRGVLAMCYILPQPQHKASAKFARLLLAQNPARRDGKRHLAPTIAKGACLFGFAEIFVNRPHDKSLPLALRAIRQIEHMRRARAFRIRRASRRLVGVVGVGHRRFFRRGIRPCARSFESRIATSCFSAFFLDGCLPSTRPVVLLRRTQNLPSWRIIGACLPSRSKAPQSSR